MADALSRIESVTTSLNYDDLARSQRLDGELKELLTASGTSLQLKRVKLLNSDTEIYCDISIGRVRPFVTKPLRRQAFMSTHELSHPGIKATVSLVKQRFVWPYMDKDCREWTRSCLDCQRAKVSKHVSSPVGNFALPSTRFEHVHIDHCRCHEEIGIV